jgi:hypothetical protein
MAWVADVGRKRAALSGVSTRLPAFRPARVVRKVWLVRGFPFVPACEAGARVGFRIFRYPLWEFGVKASPSSLQVTSVESA